jgi:hypothetical protein
MRYQEPSDDLVHQNEVVFNGVAYNNQIALGNALKKAYNVRSVKDITSCNTCHR